MAELNSLKVAVVGAGAVGCYYGAKLAKAGADVVLIGRAAAMQAIDANGLTIESGDRHELIRLRTSTELAAAAGCALVLFCVKTTDTVDTAKTLQPCLSPDACLVSLQNGVDNVERIHSATGLRAVPAAVYVAVEVAAPGRLLHKGRGDLSIGAFPFPDGLTNAESVTQVAAWFTAAGVPCKASADVVAELWTKLIMNTAVNALSAIAQVPYGRMLEVPDVRIMIEGLVQESVQVARADGVQLPQQDYVAAAFKLIQAMSGQYSSTAQDIARGKRTEIDALNGHVARLAVAHGIDAPLNRWLTALVKLKERSERSIV